MSTPRRFSRFLLLPTFALALVAGGVALVNAQSAPSPIDGYAWSSNVGWLHFKGTNYGVYEDPGTIASSGYALLSGYAWSPYVGWITFNQSDLSGCPSGQCSARIDFSSGSTFGEVFGWARSCAAFANKNACSGALEGTWSGWIHLNSNSNSANSYRVSQNTSTCAWSGYAWGGDPIGWINMSGSTYGVTGPAQTPAVCAGLTASFTAISPIFSGQSSTLTWSSTNASTCVGTGFNTNDKPSGNVSTGPLTQTTNYQLTCNSSVVPGVQVSKLVTVQVIPVTITASPARVVKGGTTTIAWDATGLKGCKVTDQNGTVIGTGDKGSTTQTITAQSTYTLTCNGANPSSVIVNVTTRFNEF